MAPEDLQLRLLSLDGGGVRGLSTLYILRDLMNRVAGPGNPVPKPCECFDMIGGSSTGGLIAIMLGRLKLSVDDCIDAYSRLSSGVFSAPRKPDMVQRTLATLSLVLNYSIDPKFDSEKLEAIIKKEIKDARFDENELLKSPDTSCRVFVTAVSDSTSQSVCLKSYETHGSDDLIDHTKIWEACRATSAAKTYFDPVEIGPNRERFSDGGLRANNPVHQVWDQARKVWKRSDSDLRRSIGCFVSIGTGLPKLPQEGSKLKEILKVLQVVATDTESTAEEFARGYSDLRESGRYFRINTPRGLDGIGLHAFKKLPRIASATRSYIETAESIDRAQACADALAGRLAAKSLVKSVFDTQITAFTVDKCRIPFTADKFVPRPSETEKICRQLLPSPRPAVDRRRVFVLSGVGGIGKTQLAAQFCQEHKSDFTSIFWIKGNTESDVRRSFVEHASTILEDQITQRGKPKTRAEEELIVQDVLTWLGQEHNRKWLLVFDNVDLDETSSDDLEKGAYSIGKYMPGDHGAILITTRLIGLESHSAGTVLGFVDQEMSRHIFKSWHGDYDELGEVADFLSTQPKKAESMKLLEIIGGLPIVIAHTAHYIKKRGVSIAEYVQLWETEWAYVSGARSRVADYHTPMGLTWRITLRKIRRDDLYGIHAYELVKFWAFLDNKDFWYGLLSRVKRQPEEWADKDPEGLSIEEWKSRYEWLELPSWLQTMSQERVAFIEAVDLLHDNGLIQRQRWGMASNSFTLEEMTSLYMHPVIHQSAMQLHLSDTGDDRMASLNIALSLFDVGPPSMNTWDYARLQRWTPHADKCFQWALEVKDTKLRAASLSPIRSICGLLKIGALYYVQGLFAKTESVTKLANEALDARQKQGKLTPWMVRWRCAYTAGSACMYQKKFGRAEEKLLEALEVARRAAGERDVQRSLESQKQLCQLYCHMGDLQKGIKSLRELTSSLEAFPFAERDEHHKRMAADVTMLLGMACIRNDDIKLAEEQLHEASNRFASLTTPATGSKLVVDMELGQLYLKTDRYQEAGTMLRKAVEGNILHRGERHLNTVQSIVQLSTALAKQGLFEEAWEQLEQLPDDLDGQTMVTVLNGRRVLEAEQRKTKAVADTKL